MKLWIDADAAPREVKEIVFRAALRLKIETVLVANAMLPPPRGNPFVTAVLVPGGADVADRHIAEHAVPGDLAITADIPLAAALVAKQVQVLDPRGEEYGSHNVGERLAVRNLMDSLRGSGAVTGGGPAPYSTKDRHAFATALDQMLTRLTKRRG
ncbi:MAG: YaiI/YqxD family protein [Planctomycetaceae bacterium]|nr:YaiI/YqxD family protein [Planctomycetaceae bacterium]